MIANVWILYGKLQMFEAYNFLSGCLMLSRCMNCSGVVGNGIELPCAVINYW